MKHTCIFLLLFILINFVYAQDTPRNSITTYGTVELNVSADFATVAFSIKSKGSSLREAVDKAKERIEVITSAIIGMGIKEKNISTSNFYSGENVGDKSFFSSKSDYKTEISTFVKVDSLKILEDVILEISDYKPDEIRDITFELSNPEEHKMQALNVAIKKAEHKAEILASELDVTIEKTIKAEEILTTIEPVYRTRGGRSNPFNTVYFLHGVQQTGKSIYSENIKIESQVKLVVSIK